MFLTYLALICICSKLGYHTFNYFQKSLCSYRDYLQDNGHWFFRISRFSPMEWSLIFISRSFTREWLSIFPYIKDLFDGKVIDFHMFISRPDLIEWSLIFICSYRGPLWGNGHRSSVYRGPLRWNGHWFSLCLHWCGFFLEPEWN